MNASSVATLWGSNIASFGLHALAILAGTLGIAVALLVFRFGWFALLHDQSLEIGGYYLRSTPFKGYNRFRSKKWNIEHMP